MQPLPLITDRTALFLDFDGTLVNIAPQPVAVRVAPELVPALRALQERLDGALAIISGRQLSQLDGFLAPLQLPAAAEHGAQVRHADGSVLALAAPDLDLVSRAVHRLVVLHPALLAEQKDSTLALHYRQAPELESLCLETLTEAVSRTPGTELLRGKCVFEVKPVGANKGLAIAAFMGRPPFEGRIPLFVGDDMTDEDGFAMAQRLGGQGVKVGDGPTQAWHRCESTAALLAWLQEAAVLSSVTQAAGKAQGSPA